MWTHTCLAGISLDSALKKDDNYYLQVFSKEYKYIEKKVIKHINDNLSNFSSFNEPVDEYMFFDRYSSWLLFSLLLTRKHAYKV